MISVVGNTQSHLNLTLLQVVVLCGGLSCSTYIHDQIQAFCQKNEIELITPDTPWSAIAKGAVLYGMHPKSLVDARKCRQSYGMCVHRKHDGNNDVDEDDIIECPIYGTRIKNCIEWHIKKVQIPDCPWQKRCNNYMLTDSLPGSNR